MGKAERKPALSEAEGDLLLTNLKSARTGVPQVWIPGSPATGLRRWGGFRPGKATNLEVPDKVSSGPRARPQREAIRVCQFVILRRPIVVPGAFRHSGSNPELVNESKKTDDKDVYRQAGRMPRLMTST